MARKDSENQKKSMGAMFRGRAIFKPLNTGRIDEHVTCVREWVANIFFYTKNGTTIMIDAGYNYERLAEKMEWLDIDPKSVQHILITHQDTDHVGALERDSELLFKDAPYFVKDYHAYYKTPRGYHARSLNSNNGWTVNTHTSLMNTRLFTYAREIRGAVLMIHGDRAHSCYMSRDAYANMVDGSKYADNKELYIIPGASHTDLYDGGGKEAIPFDKIEAFMKENLG